MNYNARNGEREIHYKTLTLASPISFVSSHYGSLKPSFTLSIYIYIRSTVAKDHCFEDYEPTFFPQYPFLLLELITGIAAEELKHFFNTQFFSALLLFILSVLVSNKHYINRWSNKGTLCLFVGLSAVLWKGN